MSRYPIGLDVLSVIFSRYSLVDDEVFVRRDGCLAHNDPLHYNTLNHGEGTQM